MGFDTALRAYSTDEGVIGVIAFVDPERITRKTPPGGGPHDPDAIS